MTSPRRAVLAASLAAFLTTVAVGRPCAAGPPEPAGEGLAFHSVVSEGVERAYAAYLPESPEPGPRPVVLDLHGTGSHPAQELAISGLAAPAEELGFAVLLPVAAVPHPRGGHTWNVPPDPEQPDDVRFLLDLLTDASRRHGLDVSRVWVTGFSGGARLASAFAGRHPDRVAALAAVGGLRAPGADGAPVPVLAVHGSRDPINPYDGGGEAYWGYGIDRALSGWVARNRCSEEAGEGAVAPAVQRQLWRDCAGDSEVALYRFEGGHVWPGSAVPLPAERFGPAPRGFDATAVLIEFFERHGLHPSGDGR